MEAATETTMSNGSLSGEGVVSVDDSNQNAETIHGQTPDPSTEEKNFELMDSLYHAAVNGDTDRFIEQANPLIELLTPNSNTMLHIHITARPKPAKQSKTNSFVAKLCLNRRSESRAVNPNNKNFVNDILNICPELLWKSNIKGETLLHIAAKHGHPDIVEILIAECKKQPYQMKDEEKGIEATRVMLGWTNEAKDTALHEAVRYNHLDVVKILISTAPDLSYEANKDGETPLYLAAERGYREIVKEILDICPSPADHGPDGRTALHAAVIAAHSDITNKLLAHKGILTSKVDNRKKTPLHYAARLGLTGITRKLLTKDKSSAYKADEFGQAPIHLAASIGEVNIMEELLLKCPGCFELVTSGGFNVLHYALCGNNKRAVQFILQNPQLRNLINERDEKGNTPLLLHAAFGSYMPSFICHPKVDRLAFDSQNRNAIDIVSENPLLFDPEFTEDKWRRDLRIRRGQRIKTQKDNKGEGNEKNNVSRKSTDSAERRDKLTEINDAREAHLIVATLIATVTFTAGFTVPGGFVDDKGPDQGAAILSGSSAFKAFVIFNTMAMILSSSVVFIHLLLALTKKRRRFMKLFLKSLEMTSHAMLLMVLAFITGTYSILNQTPALAISACVIGCLYIFVYTWLPLDINIRFWFENIRRSIKNIYTLVVYNIPKCGCLKQ